jgi:predicted dehydrogenase
VVLADVPVGDERSWTGLASPINQRVMLSRPLRFDRLLATTKATIRAGAVGTPRVVQISWTFADAADGGHVDRRVIELATELADAALWLLDDRASAVYAVSCTVDGPPLARVNLQTRQGSLALLEASVATPGLPAFRDLGLQASDGAIYHRATRDDLLWTTDGVGILSYPDDALAREAAAWAGQAPGDGQDLARSDAVIDNVAAMRAIADSLARGEPVSVVEGLV